MLRRELLDQLRAIRPVPEDQKKHTDLIEEIEDNGVLDIQAPDDIVKWMGLPRPPKASAVT